MRISLLKTIAIFLLFPSCQRSQETLFTKINSENSKLNFTNQVVQSHSRNQAHNYYFYNGAGVTICDFNNDGLEDVLMVGNHLPSRLYLNKGDFVFEDVTKQAGILNNYWMSGSTYADVNGDSWNDIFINTVGKGEPNLLYINQGADENGIPKFEEKSLEYGLGEEFISTQAAFFDFDRDNDLDLFIAINSQQMYNRDIPKNQDQTSYTKDKLYRNNGDDTFTNISEEAGIIYGGYSLGIAINDLNNDCWPDIYVANDFISNDLIYINNKQGAFEEKGIEFLKHASKNGMGVDIADINQDGLMDITVVDMLPQSNRRRKLMQSPMNYDLFEYRKELGYIPQHIRNTLQLNGGQDPSGVFHFSEIGCLAGMYSTDWSWAPLWADFDNDGSLDLFISNGYPKDLTDLDWALGLGEKMQNGTETFSANLKMDLLSELRSIKENNVLYKNSGGLMLKDISLEAGFSDPSYSHGAAFADLDNDGDLDLVVNNLEQEAFLFRNNTAEKENKAIQNNYLKIELKGPGKNTNGLGAKLTLFYKDKSQTYYHSNVRGYLSSMSSIIHFGLGAWEQIDSLTINWPDGTYQSRRRIAVNQHISIDYEPSKKSGNSLQKEKLFIEVADSLKLIFHHKENKFTDFKNDPLFLKMYSKEGPAMAVGDVNGDGSEDLIIGGASGRKTTLFTQKQGRFETKTIVEEDSLFEDMGMLLFDLDNDNDLDLYVVSGGNEQPFQSQYYEDRLYLYNGNKFVRSKDLPNINFSGGTVRGADFDRDGDIDLFVGGKISPGQYPLSPESALLINNEGKLSNITPPELKEIGMISDALWTDFNGDGWVDLIAIGEWTEILFFVNNQGKLESYKNQTGLPNTSGWWNSISAGDFDNDEDIDYVLGNFGLNTYISASIDMPIQLYARDFDDNGKIDPVISHFTIDDEGNQKEFPLHPRDALIDQIVGYKKQFRDYKSFAEAGFSDILKKEEIEKGNILKATTLTSSFLENLGNGKFEIRPLPLECQVSPIYGTLSQDVNRDGNMDIIISGNQYSSEPLFGNMDASNGLYLIGDGTGNFKPISSNESGLYLSGDHKSLVSLYKNDQPVFVSGVNSGKLMAYEYGQSNSNPSVLIKLNPLDVFAEVTYKDNKNNKHEFYYGNTYLSQGSRKMEILDIMSEVVIFNSKGESRKIK